MQPAATPSPLPAPSPGELDATFGDGGIVRTTFSERAGIHDIALQPDGRIVAAGTIGGDLAVARYGSDGRLDEEFAGGVFRLDLGGAPAGANAVALQSDGRVVVGGFIDDRPLLVRLTADGVLDATFGDGGVVVVDTSNTFGTVDDVVLQSHDRIVATVRGGATGVLVRRAADGSPDPSFGADGAAPCSTTPDICWFSRLAVRADDVLFAGGDLIRDGAYGLLVRYPPNADVPPTVLLPAAGNDRIGGVRGVALEREGTPLAGLVGPVKLARFDAGGRPRLFGDTRDSGQITVGMGIDEIAVDTAGRIVASGTYFAPGRIPDPVLTLVRFEADGSLDESFGHGGLISSDADDVGQATGLVLQPDGKIVLSAAGALAGKPSFTLLRFGG